MGSLGYLILLPLIGTCWLAIKAVDACIKRGRRLLGLLICLLLGGFCIGLGYFLSYEGWTELRGSELYLIIYPVVGWFGMVIGASIILVGIDLTWKNISLAKE